MKTRYDNHKSPIAPLYQFTIASKDLQIGVQSPRDIFLKIDFGISRMTSALRTLTRFTIIASIVVFVSQPMFAAAPRAPQTDSQQDWAKWRGPNGDGIAVDSKNVPTKWSDSENVVWKTKVPGKGHSSPIIRDGKIFLTTADEANKTQLVLCYDQKTGKQLWSQTVSSGGFPGRIHPKNTHASPSVALAGDRLLAVFNHHDAVHAYCFDTDGKELWKKEIGKYVSNFAFGFGGSPIAFNDTFIVPNENKTDSAMIALKADSGDEVYRIERGLPKGYRSVQNLTTSYSTPVIAEIAGKTQMLISGINHIASYDPATGKENWKAPATWDVSCGTMVWDKQSQTVFASGGYPTQQTLAVKADGSGKKVWDNRTKCYEQSLVVVDGYVYGQAERGTIYCWDGKTGELQWEQRERGPESASPVVVGDNIYFTNETGTTLVIKASPDEYTQVAKNQLGDVSFASFAVCNDQIFTRVAFNEDGKRQEWLYCLGDK
jgi:outer membrane protein assembly factor BamB